MPPSPAILNRYITTFSGSLKAIHLLILILPFVSGRHVEGDPCFTSLGLYSFDVSLQMVYWKENSRDYKRNFDHWISKRKKKPHSIPTRFPLSQYFGSFFFLLLRCFPTQNTQQKISWCSHMCSSPHKHAHTYSLLPAICFCRTPNFCHFPILRSATARLVLPDLILFFSKPSMPWRCRSLLSYPCHIHCVPILQVMFLSVSLTTQHNPRDNPANSLDVVLVSYSSSANSQWRVFLFIFIYFPWFPLNPELPIITACAVFFSSSLSVSFDLHFLCGFHFRRRVCEL